MVYISPVRKLVKKNHCDIYNFLLFNQSEIQPYPTPISSIHRPCHDELKMLILGICALLEHFSIRQPLFFLFGFIFLKTNIVPCDKNVSLNLRLFLFVVLGVKFALVLSKCNAISFFCFVSALFFTVLVSS